MPKTTDADHAEQGRGEDADQPYTLHNACCLSADPSEGSENKTITQILPLPWLRLLPSGGMELSDCDRAAEANAVRMGNRRCFRRLRSADIAELLKFSKAEESI